MKKLIFIILCMIEWIPVSVSAFCHYPQYEINDKKTDGSQENVMEQVEEAKSTGSLMIDRNNGTMYFFLDDNNGWRLVVADAACGSRFYVMEKTTDGGITWERINENPYSGQAGVAEGLIFFDKNFGFAGLAGASQSHSAMYMTRDGGMSFEEIELPMDTVIELPELAKECGFTVEDYDYLNMPENNNDILKITVTTDVVETDGIVFLSIDNGFTWEYNGVTQKN